MTRRFIVILTIAFSGCSETPQSRVEKIKLIENLGVIEMQIPIEYDSLLIWKDWTDYHCGTEYKTRYAISDFNPVMETGFINSIIPDSVYQITIYTNPIGCAKSIADKTNTLEFYKEQLEQTGTYNFLFQKELQVDNKPSLLFGFNLGTYNGKRKDVFQEIWGSENLELYIEHRDQIITIKFECSGTKCNDYIEKSKDLIKNIKID